MVFLGETVLQVTSHLPYAQSTALLTFLLSARS